MEIHGGMRSSSSSSCEVGRGRLRTVLTAAGIAAVVSTSSWFLWGSPRVRLDASLGWTPTPEDAPECPVPRPVAVGPATGDRRVSPVRIYVYPLSEFPASLQLPPYCGAYSPGADILRYIGRHPDRPWLVTSAPDATHFLLPITGSCMWNKAGYEAGVAYMLAAIEFVRSRWPYLAARGGTDHIMDVTWPDNDRCAFNASVRSVLRPFIGLSVFGDTRPHGTACHIQGQDILMPHNGYLGDPTVDYNCATAIEAFGHNQSHRKILGLFRGTVNYGQATPPNIIRPPMVAAVANESDFVVSDVKIDWPSHFSEVRHAVFMLVPAAFEMATARLWVAVGNGAIPVVVSDHLRMPFDEAVGASGIAVVVRWHDVRWLASILRSITPEEVARRQRALPALARAWNYHLDAVEHMVWPQARVPCAVTDAVLARRCGNWRFGPPSHDARQCTMSSELRA